MRIHRAMLFSLSLILTGLGAAAAYHESLPIILALCMVGLGLIAAVFLFLVSLTSLTYLKERNNFSVFCFLYGAVATAIVGFLCIENLRNPLSDITNNGGQRSLYYAVMNKEEKVGVSWIDNLIPKSDLQYNYLNQIAQKKAYGLFYAVHSPSPPLPIYAFIKNVIKENFLNWELVNDDLANYHLEYMQKTNFFHLINNIVIEVVTDVPTNERYVLIRIKNRYGIPDLGINARQVTRFLALIGERLVPPLELILIKMDTQAVPQSPQPARK